MHPVEHATEQLEYALRHLLPNEGDAADVTRAIRNLMYAVAQHQLDEQAAAGTPPHPTAPKRREAHKDVA